MPSNEASLQHLAQRTSAAISSAFVAGARSDIRLLCTPSMSHMAKQDCLYQPLCDIWSKCDQQTSRQISPARYRYPEDRTPHSETLVDVVRPIWPSDRDDSRSLARVARDRSIMSPKAPISPTRATALLRSHVSTTSNVPLSHSRRLYLYRKGKPTCDDSLSTMLGRPPLQADEAASNSGKNFSCGSVLPLTSDSILTVPSGVRLAAVKVPMVLVPILISITLPLVYSKIPSVSVVPDVSATPPVAL